MIDTPFQPDFLQRVKHHVEREESLLSQLQQALRQLGRLRPNDTGSATNEDLLRDPLLLSQLSAEAESLSRSRRELRIEAANSLGITTKEIQFASLLKRLGTPNALEVAESIKQVRKNLTRTLGILQASIRSLLIERQLIEVSLEALGVGVIQEKYDESGGRLTIHPESHLETRS